MTVPYTEIDTTQGSLLLLWTIIHSFHYLFVFPSLTCSGHRETLETRRQRSGKSHSERRCRVGSNAMSCLLFHFAARKDGGCWQQNWNRRCWFLFLLQRLLCRLVAIAGDISPLDVISHLPVYCEEKDVPYVFVSSKVRIWINGYLRCFRSFVL